MRAHAHAAARDPPVVRQPPVESKVAGRLPRPFEGNYWVSLVTAILSLLPYIIVTSGYALYREQVSQEVGASPTALEVVSGLSAAGYAFGALCGGDLINRFKQRPLFLLFEALFVLGCALSAIGGDIVVYGTGSVLQRTFALVELVRSVADFILAPVTLLYVLGGVGLPRPDIDSWIEKDRPAIRSPLLAETLREAG